MKEKKTEYKRQLRRGTDIQAGRIIFIDPVDTGGDAWWRKSMKPITKPMTLRVQDVTWVKGMGVEVTGTAVTQRGDLRRNAVPVTVLVREGSFIVFTHAEDGSPVMEPESEMEA